MKDLQEATERICELKGSQIALDVLATALLRALPAAERERVLECFAEMAEVARTVLLHRPISDITINTFENDVRRLSALNDVPPAPAA